ELLAVDRPPGADLLAEVDLVVARDHGHRDAARRLRDLDGLAPEPARAAPDEDDVAGFHRVRGPAHQHAVRRGADQHVRRRRVPRQMLRLRQALVRLDAGELREASPVRLVAPDAEARTEHGIVAGLDGRIVGLPDAAVDDDVIAGLHRRHRAARLPHDAGGIAAADVKRRLVGPLLVARPRLDHVDRRAQAGPHVVVVDAGGHHPDQHLVRTQLARRGDLLDLERLHGLAETILADQLGEHPRANSPGRRGLTELVELLHAAGLRGCRSGQYRSGLMRARKSFIWYRRVGLGRFASPLVDVGAGA